MHSSQANSHAAQLATHGAAHCERCRAPFHCGANDAAGCWCAKRFPAVVSGQAGSSCLCPRCLKELIEKELLDQ